MLEQRLKNYKLTDTKKKYLIDYGDDDPDTVLVSTQLEAYQIALRRMGVTVTRVN